MKKCLRVKDIIDFDKDYDDKIFLTFDIDWASDEVLAYTLDIVEKNDVSATFFVTHDTPLLDQMKNNPKIELGIHPNFNFLLNGDFRYGKNYIEVIEYYLKMVPDAVSCRSHSLVQSSQILNSLSDLGIKYELNLHIPISTSAPFFPLWPIQHFNNKLIRLPHFWEDDTNAACEKNWDPLFYLDRPGLKIFGFHPFHIFLNMENMDRYLKAKPYYHDFEMLQDCVNESNFGTKDFLLNIIQSAK